MPLDLERRVAWDDVGTRPEFRRKVLDLVETGRPVAEVADNLGESVTRRSTPGGDKTASTAASNLG